MIPAENMAHQCVLVESGLVEEFRYLEFVMASLCGTSRICTSTVFGTSRICTSTVFGTSRICTSIEKNNLVLVSFLLVLQKTHRY